MPEDVLSVIVKPAENAFLDAGVKVTEMVQLAPATSVLGQALAGVKSAAFVPEIAMFVIFNAVPPVLVRSTFFVVLLFTGSFPKFKLVGWKLA